MSDLDLDADRRACRQAPGGGPRARRSDVAANAHAGMDADEAVRLDGIFGSPAEEEVRLEKLAAYAEIAQDKERAAAIRASNIRAAADGIL
jgi:hypothetical protein